MSQRMIVFLKNTAIFVTTIVVAGCGGGNNSSTTADRSPSVSLNSTTIAVSATPGEAKPVRTLTLTLNNAVNSSLHFSANYTNNGIESIDSVSDSLTQETISFRFKSPASLPNGSYTDTVTIRICNDQACTSQLQGSPVTVSANYNVAGTGIATATIDRPTIFASVGESDQTRRTETATISLTPAPATAVFASVTSTSPGISPVTYRTLSSSQGAIDVQFAQGSSLAVGTYNSTITVRVCYDASCLHPVSGSPYSIPTTLTVELAPEPGYTPLAVQSRTALGHNIIDAEYSKALNQIVMVGTYPVNALYTYDVATSVERKQLLNKQPTAVSLSPQGLTAAVGHDALVSIVDLTTVGQSGATAPTLLNVSADVFDLVMDGRGSVHAFPRTDQWVNPHSIAIATNTEQLGSWLLYAGSRARLHPSGDFIYTADNGLSPSDIAKWNITSGVALRLYDSPYHGDYSMCGNVWFNESGTTIYTACGNAFRSSTTQTQDMVYAGRMALSQSAFSSFQIESLSHSSSSNEIALIESDSLGCTLSSRCYTHVGLYESQFLNRQSVFSIPPFSVSGKTYAQRGIYVFHNSSGTQKYVLSRLIGMPNPDTEYYISRIN